MNELSGIGHVGNALIVAVLYQQITASDISGNVRKRHWGACRSSVLIDLDIVGDIVDDKGYADRVSVAYACLSKSARSYL